jgi:3'-phosphoadenosine 5'-phosphosulfate sulfotransferase (PAPS reductase)/FAD synthetase
MIDVNQEITEAIEQAQTEHHPHKWFVAYSGGSDSAVALQAMIELGYYEQLNMHIMTIDTGLSSCSHIERITQDIIQATDEPPMIYRGKGLAWYLANVTDFGFGYTPGHHAPYYQYLKRAAIEQCVREHKESRFDRIAFVTGVRRVESPKRATTPLVMRSKSRVTVNAIATLDDHDKMPFLERATWYQGKVTRDCLCNWHCQYTLDDLRDTPAYEPIKQLSEDMRREGLWGYGEKPSEDWLIESKAEEMDSDSFCVSCMQLQLL